MREFRGYGMIIAAAVLWGLSATAAKFLFTQNVDTILVVQSRVTFSAILLAIALALFRPHLLRTSLRDLWRFALLGIAGVAGANITYYVVIRETTVATGILIQYTAPLLVLAYAVASGDERVTPVKVAAALLALGGCFLAVGGYDRSLLRMTPLALASGIGSTVTFAFLTVYSRRLVARLNPWTTVMYALIFASLFWLVINPPWTVAANAPAGTVWGALLGLAIISVLLPHSLFVGGLQHVVPSRALILSTLEPVVAIGSAVALLGERQAAGQYAGAVLVLAAVVLLNRKPEAGTDRWTGVTEPANRP